MVVQHDWQGGPLERGTPGFELKDVVSGEADLRLVKTVHSSFHADVDLDAWLRERQIGAIAVCGIQTNVCCETTARIGSDLGYDVWFVLDATHTFDDKRVSITAHAATKVNNRRVTSGSFRSQRTPRRPTQTATTATSKTRPTVASTPSASLIQL